MKYKLIDHTADFGIHVFGSDIKALFENAAHAMFELMIDTGELKSLTKRQIVVQGDDWPDLMVNWLRELLAIWNIDQLVVKDTEILSTADFKIDAIVKADPFDPTKHEIKMEIKAVTYHQIDVHRGSTGWESKIIFDV
ncbi:MAG: archease [Deltaproteobacteria bacterium]|nr:archease [Deltaproteobacteria bacterium]MBW1959888.1 archease [Deltaproteobacteria bacterium]MBW2150402.1 archease [Deltaproteobacteria bacterium]